MPIYIAHGFRWPRDGYTGIRVHCVVHNLEAVSVEYIQNDHSRSSLIASFRLLYPDIMNVLGSGSRRMDFLEMYDPNDFETVFQPYAFVVDRVAMIAGGTEDDAQYHLNKLYQTQAEKGKRSSSPAQKKKQLRAKTQPMSFEKPFNDPASITGLSASLEEITSDARAPALNADEWAALAELRDNIAEGEKIGWFVIYNGDPDRAYDDSEEDDEDEDAEDEEESDTKKPSVVRTGSDTPTATSPKSVGDSTAQAQQLRPSPERSGTDEGKDANRGRGNELTRIQSPTSGRVPPPVPPPTKSSGQRPPSSKSTVLPFRNADQTPPPPVPYKDQAQTPKLPEPTTSGSKTLKQGHNRSSSGLRKKFFGSKKG